MNQNTESHTQLFLNSLYSVLIKWKKNTENALYDFNNELAEYRLKSTLSLVWDCSLKQELKKERKKIMNGPVRVNKVYYDFIA